MPGPFVFRRAVGLITAAAWSAALLAAGCGEDSTAPPPPPKVEWPPCAVSDSAASDFSLVDVNPNSATRNQQVSPRPYLGAVSAWYFGHST